MAQANPVKRTGMIGLGAMGLQMGRHMVRKGFDVAGYDVDTEAMRRAESHGVRKTGSPAEVGKHAEVVVVMVATDKQVETVIEARACSIRWRPARSSASPVRSRRKPAGASPRSRRKRASASAIRRWCSARKPPTTAR